jgi:hypothetical protein
LLPDDRAPAAGDTARRVNHDDEQIATTRTKDGRRRSAGRATSTGTPEPATPR